MVTAINLYNTICSRIIREQEAIVGSLAWEITARVTGLAIVSKALYRVSIQGEPISVIDDMVSRFEKMFGDLALDVCKRAVADILPDVPAEDVPLRLK